MKVIPLHNNFNALIKRLKASDRKAQHQLFEMLSPKMLSVCRYYINDLQFAESTMLKAFLKVFKNISQFNNQGSFEGWVRKIMVRECISYLRQQKHIEFSTETIPETNDVTINSDLDIDYLQQLIDALPEGYKIVFIMYAIEGYKHAEIASELNISVGTSKSQLFKARQLLQQQLSLKNIPKNGTK